MSEKVYITSYTIDGVPTKIVVYADTLEDAQRQVETAFSEDGVEILAKKLKFREFTRAEYRDYKRG